jgi:hypothetical protein
MKNYGNTFNKSTQDYPVNKVPTWLFVDELYPAGCTLNGYPQGSTIPAGTPVNVAKMGAEATILETFEVVGAVTAEGTSVVLKSVSGAVDPAKDMIVGKIGSNGLIAKALKLPAVTSVGSGDHEGEYTFTITANSLGALSDGDILVMASAAGSSKAPLYPTGLLYEEVYIGNVGATGTVVTKGQVLADRIAAVPAAYLPYLTNITFVNE